MSVIRLNRILNLKPSCFYRNMSTELRKEEEYTDQPNYPEIFDVSGEAVRARSVAAYHESLKDIQTVEEKIFKLNMPKYYGWKSVQLREHYIPLQSLPFMQHTTRTHFIKANALPDFYLSYDSAAGYIVKQLKSEIEDAIMFEYQGLRRKFQLTKDTSDARQVDDLMAKSVLTQINRILTNHLSSNLPHIMDSQLDIEPRHEAFWFTGGYQDMKPRKPKNGNKGDIPYAPRDNPFQYHGKPVLTLRSGQPLEPIVPYSDADNESLEVPFYDLDPRANGFFATNVHGTNIPGFWPGDSHEYGLLSYHSRGYIEERKYGWEDNREALDTQGIMASFGWLMSQATYQGFNTYNDITYPLTTQTIISNGQLWSFYAYQLNTLLLHSDNTTKNRLRNICYGTEPLKLFESIDDKGKIIGFNDDVLKMLVQFYVNAPKERSDTLMKPYLGERVKVIADIEDEVRREWLEKYYKHLVSNRPRQKLMYEVYHWEKIYKIKFQTRFHEARRRPFELDQNPFNRRLDEHTPKYIPKELRPGGARNRKKWETTYYP